MNKFIHKCPTIIKHIARLLEAVHLIKLTLHFGQYFSYISFQIHILSLIPHLIILVLKFHLWKRKCAHNTKLGKTNSFSAPKTEDAQKFIDTSYL